MAIDMLSYAIGAKNGGGGGGGGNAPIVYTYVGSYTRNVTVPFSYNDVKTAILGGNRVIFHNIDEEASVESWEDLYSFFEQESDGQMSYGVNSPGGSFVSTDPDEDMTWL